MALTVGHMSITIHESELVTKYCDFCQQDFPADHFRQRHDRSGLGYCALQQKSINDQHYLSNNIVLRRRNSLTTRSRRDEKSRWVDRLRHVDSCQHCQQAFIVGRDGTCRKDAYCVLPGGSTANGLAGRNASRGLIDEALTHPERLWVCASCWRRHFRPRPKR